MKLGNAGRLVRVGVTGLGNRSKEQIRCLLSMKDVEIVSVCDVYEDRARDAQDAIEGATGRRPLGTTNYRELNATKDIEAVFIFTSWQTHIRIAVDAMRRGVIPAMEVGGANSLDDCWEMVRTSEQTGVPLMLLENCCYNREEMTLLNMVKQGVFGEIIHCRGGYQHDLRDEIGNGDINRHYRQDNFMHRNGELYPTHELGPIAQYLNINRGNRIVMLTSVSSKSVGQGEWMRAHRAGSALEGARFNQGDVVTTVMKCANGETIALTHDCTLPRPYSRGGYLQGSKGLWLEDGRMLYLEGRTPLGKYGEHVFETDAPYMKEYLHPLWREYEEYGLRGGHGGMDYLALRAFIESIQKGVEFPIDVYDAATWMAVTCLSEASIATGSMPQAMPDFTNGLWVRRPQRPGDIFSLDRVYTEAFED